MFLVSKCSIQSYFDVFLLEHPWQRQFPVLVPRYGVMPSDDVMILAPARLWRHTFRAVFSCSVLPKEFISFVFTTWLCEQHSHIVWMVPCQVNRCFIIQHIRFNIMNNTITELVVSMSNCIICSYWYLQCHILYLCDLFSFCSSLNKTNVPPPPPHTHTHFTSPSYATGIMHKYILMLQSNSTIIIHRPLNINDFVILWFMQFGPKAAKFIETCDTFTPGCRFFVFAKFAQSKSPHVNGELNIYAELHEPSS